MFIFGQVLLQPLIGAECENVGCALLWLSHDGTNSAAVITCTVLSLESSLAENQTNSQSHDWWETFYKCVENESANIFEMRAYVSDAVKWAGLTGKASAFDVYLTNSCLRAHSFQADINISVKNKYILT